MLAGSAAANGGFTQLPGFAEIRAGFGDAPPDADEQALLARHRPRLHVADGEEGPVDFYADYIGSGELFDGENAPVQNPTAAQLNAARDNPEAVFIHRPQPAQYPPAAYGGINHAALVLSDGEAHEFTFLHYHFSFRHSGLPAGVSGARLFLAELFADVRDWHQLDHYTAAYIVLHEGAPFAAILQQHNYMRTYLMHEEPAFANGRAVLNAALWSNELYPHRKARTMRRAAGFMNAKTTAYLTGASEDGGINAAPDITEGGREIKYELQFLPPNDAFYVFAGRLGEPRRLPGRDGPPGAMYRMGPKLWALEKSMPAFYWKDEDAEYAEIMREDGFSAAAQKKYLERFTRAFYRAKPHLNPAALAND